MSFRVGVLGAGLALLGIACGSSQDAAPQGGSVSSGPGGTGTTGGSGGTTTGTTDDAGFASPADASTPPGDPSGSPGAPGSSDDAGASAPSGPACPSTAVWAPGTSMVTVSIDIDGGARSYDVYVGTGVKPGVAAPLVVNMHGLTNSPTLQATFSQMNPVADTNGFIVAYPAGLGASFNAGSCCGFASTTQVDDVAFVRAVVADVESKICVDTKRVYETGFSNGGMMAYELACNAADLFAAVAPTEGDNQTIGTCSPSRPVPLAAFESLGDPIIIPASAQASVEAWAKQTGCTDSTPPETAQASFTCQEWSQCSGGAKVQYCTLPGGTHYPPAGSAPLVWAFLSQFSLP